MYIHIYIIWYIWFYDVLCDYIYIYMICINVYCLCEFHHGLTVLLHHGWWWFYREFIFFYGRTIQFCERCLIYSEHAQGRATRWFEDKTHMARIFIIVSTRPGILETTCWWRDYPEHFRRSLMIQCRNLTPCPICPIKHILPSRGERIANVKWSFTIPDAIQYLDTDIIYTMWIPLVKSWL